MARGLAMLLVLLAGCDGQPWTSFSLGGQSTPEEVDCAGFTNEDACVSAGCAFMRPQLITDMATCELEARPPLCQRRLVNILPGTRTAFFADMDGFTVFAPVGCAAVASQAEVPLAVGWSECTGGDGDPPGCSCFCARNHCPAEPTAPICPGT